MTRLTSEAVVPPPEEVEFFLTFGPLSRGPREFTAEQAKAAWSAHGPQIMAEWPRNRPGFRPWAFWRFEVGEEVDHEDHVIFLAERGLLYPEEIDALAEKRTWTDINDGSEHTDPEAVELYEAVIEAIKKGAPTS